jgi:hypothetical protein
MSTRFLTPEWAKLFEEALNADEGFRKQTAKRRSLIRWDVSAAPDGDVDYYVDIDRGTADVGLGTPSRTADLNLSCSYETLVGIISGQISGRDAFQGKRLRADAKLITVLKYLGVFHEFNRVMNSLDVEY